MDWRNLGYVFDFALFFFVWLIKYRRCSNKLYTLGSNWSIDFRAENKNTIRDLLVFKPDLYDANKDHEAQEIVNIILIKKH